MDSTSSWGLSHLSDMPETVTFGVVLVLALIVLLAMRLIFGEVTIGAKGGVR
jgi:hypothetical protein